MHTLIFEDQLGDSGNGLWKGVAEWIVASRSASTLTSLAVFPASITAEDTSALQMVLRDCAQTLQRLYLDVDLALLSGGTGKWIQSMSPPILTNLVQICFTTSPPSGS